MVDSGTCPTFTIDVHLYSQHILTVVGLGHIDMSDTVAGGASSLSDKKKAGNRDVSIYT